MALGFDGSIRIKALLNHSPFDRGIQSMNNSVKALTETLMKLAEVVGIALGIGELVKFGKESIKLASDVQEVQNVIDVTFGKGAAEIEKFAQSAAEAFGLSELSAKQYTGTLGAMLKSSGLVTKDAQDMSIALTGLAGDFASFYNLDTDTAFEKIRSGISGETEPLKQLGINMSVANLEAYALSKGITKSYNAMSQAEQIMLRYNYLLHTTTDAQGDFARTSGSFANQIRILQLNFDQLKTAAGNALVTIAQSVLPGINAIIAALTRLARVFAKVTALLFGKKTAGGSSQVKEQEAIASSGTAAAGAADKLADATAGAGEASKKAAKDMKGVLASFDELNILADNTADSVSGAGGGIGDAGASDVVIPDIDLEGGTIEEIGEAFTSLGERFSAALDVILGSLPGLREALLNAAKSFNEFNKELYDAFTFPGVKEKVERLGRELAEILNDFVDEIDWELWGRTLGAGLNLGLQFLTEFLYTFNWINLGKHLAKFINGLVDEVDWYDFGRLLWAQFKIGLETLAGFLLELDMPALAKAAGNIVKGFFDSMTESIQKIDWRGIGRQIAEFLNNIDWIGIAKSISGALKSMVDAIAELLGGFFGAADPASVVAGFVIFGGILLKAVVGKVISPLAKELANNLIKMLAESLSSAGLTAIVKTIGEKLLGIGTVLLGLTLSVTSFFDMWNNGFSLASEAVYLVGIAITALGAIFLGVSGPIAWAIAAIVAVVGTLVASIHGAGAAAYKASDDFQIMEDILSESEAATNRSSEAMDNLGRNIENLNTSMADIGAAQSLVEEIYAINENANASAEELGIMATKVEILNGMGLEGLHLTIDETTGRIVETKEATDQLIVSLKKEAETAALQQLLIQAYKDRYAAVADAEQAVKNIEIAEQSLANTERELTNTPWWDLEKHAALTEQQKKQTETLEAAKEARNDAITAYDELSGAINTYSTALTESTEPEANVGVELESRMASVKSTVESVSGEMPGYGHSISEGLKKGMSDGLKEEEVTEIFSRPGKWFKKKYKINSPSKVFSEYGGYLMEGLKDGINENIPSIENDLSSFLENTEQTISNTWSNVESDTSSKWGSIKTGLSGKYSEIDGESNNGWKKIKDTIIGKIEAAMTDLLGKDWLSIGKGIVNGVMNGLHSIFEKLRGWASDVWSNITGLFSSRSISPRFDGQNVRLETGYRMAASIPESYSGSNLPRLANGAVIPPNQQFAAILGDQRSGKNIESPVREIELAVMRGIQAAGGGGRNPANVTVVLELDKREFGRAVYTLNQQESQRVGVRLAGVNT